MMWRLPRDVARNSDHIAFPLKSFPSEGVICKALTTQYLSTYKCDFMGTPQGTQFSVNVMYTRTRQNGWRHPCTQEYPDVITFHDISLYSPFSIWHSFSFCRGIFFLTEYNDTEKAARWFAPMHNRHRISLSTDTVMRANYRQPNQKSELVVSVSHCCKTDPNVTCPGIGTVYSKTIEDACKQQLWWFAVYDDSLCYSSHCCTKKLADSEESC